jgi:hypothetical protein
MDHIYFSCPKFTVLLVTKGSVIVEAAPIVKLFEGQTIGNLTSWAQSRFGGPIIVEELRHFRQESARSGTSPPEDGEDSPDSSRIDVDVGPTGVRPVPNNAHEERRQTRQRKKHGEERTQEERVFYHHSNPSFKASKDFESFDEAAVRSGITERNKALDPGFFKVRD